MCFMKKVVLSVGGSLINPGKIDVKFLKSLRSLIKNKRVQFFIVCGGGKPARDYMSAASSLGVSSDSRDDVGIAATLLNAELVRSVLGVKSVKQEPKKSNDAIVVAGGYKVGGSTDVDAVLWAKKNGINEVINCTNVDFVYNKDPKKFGARPFNWLSWDAYLKIISSKFVSGMHAPFDPVASRLAKKFGIKVIVLSGKNFPNLSRCIDGSSFVGTTIE
jgi:uridylate kinase